MSYTSWICNDCGLSNNQNKESCQACFTVRPIKEYSMHSIQNKLLAAAGYSRRIFTLKPIPQDIINLIMQFYNTTVFWTVFKDEISALQPEDSCDIDQSDESILDGPSFVIKSIQFGFQLFCTDDHTLLFQIHLPQGLPSNVTEITASVELCCQETRTEHRKFAIIDNNCYVGWRYYALTFEDALAHKQLNLSADVNFIRKNIKSTWSMP